MTERLYYNDSYLREFPARVMAAENEGRRVYLDRTAFYPASGGQPFDLGTLSGVAVLEVADEDDRIAHTLAEPLGLFAEVSGAIDWTRRYDHMQQHTGQHLLSAAFEELYGMRTLSFHMGAETSTIDLGAAAIEPQQTERVEERCAEIVAEARPVEISYEDASEAAGLRKESQRSGTLRIISIKGLDRSACGGTHVRSTAELGPILIRKLEKIRGNTRVEFVCGLRALRRARADYQTLATIGRALSAPIERAPELVAAQAERIKALEKTAHKQEIELAMLGGRQLVAFGQRNVTQRGSIDDAMRARAQAFISAGGLRFLAVCENPPSVLLAVSADAGVHAGDLVKAAVTAAGGRGGGNAVMAQGSVPSKYALDAVVAQLGLP